MASPLRSPSFWPGRSILPIPLLLSAVVSAHAIIIVPYPSETSTNYNPSNTIASTLTNWSTGWGAGNDSTGWDYVGLVNVRSGYGSGEYLGNGWVLTAGHVGMGNFTLNGNTFEPTGISYTDFTESINGTNQIADLTLFQISTISSTGSATLSMPPLAITASNNAPTAFSSRTPGSEVVMIGYGGGKGESWGINTVTQTALAVPVTEGSLSFYSADFATVYGETSFTNGFGSHATTNSVTNTAQVYPGDSGGADFLDVAGTWELAGVNEAVGTGTNNSGDSYLVQLSYYDSQIQSIISAVPEPSVFPLTALGFGLLMILATRQGGGAGQKAFQIRGQSRRPGIMPSVQGHRETA